MKQMSLKLNRYVHNANIINNDIERIALRFILWSFGVLALLYVLFLGNMVRDIIVRRSLESRILSLSSEVSSLGLTYLSLTNNVDLSRSYSMGFQETKATFATRKSIGLKSSGSFGDIKIAKNDL
jgi:hypothetical protein